MSRWNIAIAIMAVLVLSTVSGTASAGERSGTETIYGMDPFSVSFENTGSEEMQVSWNVKVTDGVPVNIVLLDEENHEKFTSYLRYEAYRGHQYNYTNSSRRTVKVEEGKYYLAIESAHSSMDHSTVDYEVKWDVDAEDAIFWAPWCIPVVVLLVMAFGLVVLYLLWMWIRMGRGAVQPAVPGGGGAETATQLGPQPEPPDMPSSSEMVRPTGEGAVQLSPQPEPPDMPASSEMVRSTGEGATELSPQPEPPDMPPAEAGEGSAHEPPAPGVTTYYGPDTAATHLGPQPEPPDMPASSEMVRPTGEGATELSPQPEPPDMPADAYKPPVDGSAELSPQPEPPDLPPGQRKPPSPGD